MPQATKLIISLIAALLFASCGQEIRDECGRPDSQCLPCETDAECVIRSQPCYDWALCVHKNVEVNFTSIGCSVEYTAPGDDACRCVAGTCRSGS